MLILFIHGVAQQRYVKDPAELLEIWRRHLATGLSQFSNVDVQSIIACTKMPFYAHLTDPDRKALASQSIAAKLLEDELREEMISEPTQAWYNNDLISGTLRHIDRNSLLQSTIGSALLTTVSEEAVVYLNDGHVRRSVHNEVLATILDGTTVDLIVGHSLGSVVAYDLLAAGSLRAKGLVTLGSPLGANAFRQRLAKVPADLRNNLKIWSDIRDPLDLVAFSKIDPASLVRKDSLPSLTFTEDEVDNATENKHGIRGYIGLRSTARRILDII